MFLFVQSENIHKIAHNFKLSLLLFPQCRNSNISVLKIVVADWNQFLTVQIDYQQLIQGSNGKEKVLLWKID